MGLRIPSTRVTNRSRVVKHNVLGPEGEKMQAQVWKEVLDVLEENVPGVTSTAKSA